MIAPKIISFILLLYLSISIPNCWANKDIPQSYEIKIAVNRLDGGDVFPVKDIMLKDAKGNVILEGKQQQLLRIENVLKALYGLDAEYIPKEKGDLNHNKSAKIALQKFNIAELDEMDIWTFANALGLNDPRWKLPSENLDRNKHLFHIMFGGHSMVVLSIGNKEVIRFHFTKTGINIFKSEEKKDYMVDENLNETFMESPDLIRKRAFYSKEGFVHSQVHTKPMTIEKMKEIAIKLINGRSWVYDGSEPDYTCMHFAFAFVMAIVEEPERKKLLSIAEWPTNFVSVVRYAESVDKITVFEDVQKDEIFRKFVKLPHA